MGYVGSVLVKQLRQQEPDAFLIGYDLGSFSHCLSSHYQIPESYLDIQYFGDARSFVMDNVNNLILGYVKCSIGECIRWDPKGLYNKRKKEKLTLLLVSIKNIPS